MNKYKVTFTESRDYVVDVWAKDEAHAREEADRCFQNDAYHEIGDPEVVIDQVYDVTNTEDPFNPENENDALDGKVLSLELFTNSEGEFEFNIAWDNDLENAMDGGCCTGTFDEAIDMMSEQAKHIIKNNNK